MEIRRQLSLDERRAKSTAWALTFADMVTLLLTFFVLLLVILNDAEKHIDRVINQLLDVTYEELQENVASSYVSVDRVTKGIKITLRGKLFKSMSADVDTRVYPLLQQVGGIIRTSKIMNVFDDEEYVPLLELIEKRGAFLNVEVRCEGHTDDLKLPRKAAYPSNWELSSARSLNLVKLLSKYAGMSEKHFSALGYGEFRPIIDVDTLRHSAQKNEARAINRRVEIYLDAFLKQQGSVGI
ncbi:MAG: OmpA family protein [Candidatus Marinimicrobia bacterium]|nr:OmpA family protein [Candidatus Neomarinimicrobiota bacterium]MBT3838979.1 OmpA family protein [Candidatus Neomarinimicrobiota bacterium]MBT3999346.1 OmpA family protein [Candidatus Neomarinimicrobiota bacterium]MBT4282702.1 OmpA family protein [Candidatus Neomarinimicrobiota bacterium]MBT4957481.1 OmpA family protein [Candidatus Neomarinimicrobiota bacterium]